MTEAEALSLVQEEILKHADKSPDEYTLDTTMDQLGVDSLDIIQMSVDLEEKVNYQFPNAELSSIRTVKDLVRIVSVIKERVQ